MKKIYYVSLIAAAVFASCDKSTNTTEPANPALVSISPDLTPVITRVSNTSFDNGDQIGVTIVKNGETYADNVLMAFSESAFSGTLTWYEDADAASDIYAYYPYDETGTPETFTVETDQSAGTSSSDFIMGKASGITPTEDAVKMTFTHALSKVIVNITNDTGYDITSVVLKGSKTTADVSVEESAASVSASSATEDIKACPVTANEKYSVILVPQTVAMTLEITTADSEVYTEDLEEITLDSGVQRTITSRISIEDGLQVKVAGEIEDWTDDGEIGPAKPALTIEKQWVADLSEAQDNSIRKCFDLATEGYILIGDWMPGIEIYMQMFGISDYDPATSFIAMVSGPEQIVSITPADETSGTIIYNSDTDLDGVGDTEITVTYSNLTENTVDITMADIFSGEVSTYNCTAASETVKVYTYADANM